MNNKTEQIRNILAPILSVVMGLVLGAMIMIGFGYNPITGYTSMLQASLGNQRSIGETLRQATPLIFSALGFSVATSAGFFHIGCVALWADAITRQRRGNRLLSRRICRPAPDRPADSPELPPRRRHCGCGRT